MSTTEDATITSKGQVTIPKRIRDELDFEEGERIQFVITEENELTIRHKHPPMERLSRVREKLAPLNLDVDDLRRQSKTEWSTIDESNFP